MGVVSLSYRDESYSRYPDSLAAEIFQCSLSCRCRGCSMHLTSCGLASLMCGERGYKYFKMQVELTQGSRQ